MKGENTMSNGFQDIIGELERQLGEALRIITENGDIDQIERMAELLILKEKLIEELIDALCQPIDTTFENSDEIVMNDDEQGPANPYPSEIDVSGLDGAIRDVTVTLYGLSHTWPMI